MNPRRLLETPLPALLDRARQEASRAIDRRRGPAAYCSGRGAPSARALADPIPERTVFFPGVASPVGQASLSSRERDSLLHSADRFCEGRFSLLGYTDLDFGAPVDWHFDPVSEKRSPRVHWSRIDALDPGAVGDSKVIWELNRHQWLVRLGEAYRLSGDERYARHFATMVRGWMRENPPGIGINWSSSLEVSIRLIAWSWALMLFRDAEAMTEGLRRQMLTGIGMHARHIEKYLSLLFSPNTHLTGEALGLYYAGTLFPGLDAGAAWRRKGRTILLEQLRKQVLDDGVYFEQSSCYQRYTAEIYLHFMLLAARSADLLPRFVGERVQLLIDWLLAVQNPDGSMPRIGDEDGGWLLPLSVRAMNDARGVFAVAAAVFARADYAWAARGEHAELFWLMGRDGLEVVSALKPCPPAQSPSRHFPSGGYAVMRASWSGDTHQLIFDTGPLGCHYSAGHGHADLLSIQCSAYGVPLLVDSGTGCYTPEPLWRNYFRSTAAHNTADVDSMGQARPLATFTWSARPAARLLAWTSTGGFDYADAAHDAFARDGQKLTHRRRVVFLKRRGAWIVIDDFLGSGEHEVNTHFQFAPRAELHHRGKWLLGSGPDGAGLFIRAYAPVRLKEAVFRGCFEPVAGWVSECYGARRPAPLLEFQSRAVWPLRVVYLIVPSRGEYALPPYATVEFASWFENRVHLRDEIVLIGKDAASIELFGKRTALAGQAGENRGKRLCAR